MKGSFEGDFGVENNSFYLVKNRFFFLSFLLFALETSKNNCFSANVLFCLSRFSFSSKLVSDLWIANGGQKIYQIRFEIHQI